jgi:signal transduction histidine kinase
MTTELRRSGIEIVGDMPGAPTFVNSMTQNRTFSILCSLILRRDWKTTNSACGWASIPSMKKKQKGHSNVCLRLLSRDPLRLDEIRDSIEFMISEAMLANEVIKRIRSLLQRGPQKSWLSINQTIEEVISLAASELVRNKVLLRTQLEDDLSPVLADRVELQQVLLNLILNAIEAMSGEGWEPRELLIKSRKNKPDEIMVSLRDSGIGFDPRNSDRIFDGFYTTKKDGTGLGLGLSISRTIIESHLGRLWATPNETRAQPFRFTIPTSGESQS